MTCHPTIGDPIDPAGLTLDRARQVAAALAWYPHASLIEARTTSADSIYYELLLVKFDVELPQDTVHDIRVEEPLLLGFERSDRHYPTVMSQRTDFPHVPHLNRTPIDAPKDLCIYEAPWSEVRLQWTGAGFLGDIARWLAKTAVGALHDADQPLEPFLLGGANAVVFPNNLFEEEQQRTAYIATGISDKEGSPYTLKLQQIDATAGDASRRLFCVTAVGEPTLQGAMHACPTNLYDLMELLWEANIDLLGMLIDEIKHLFASAAPPGEEDGLLLLVKLPRLRTTEGPIETHEYWAFGMLPVKDVASATGRFAAQTSGSGIVPLVVPQYDEALPKALPIEVFRPMQSIDRASAKLYSGLNLDSRDPKVVLVGGGALGSQLHNNLSRMGWGRWSIIDKDTLLPHNVVRHRLGEHAVGFSKAPALQHMSEVETPFNPLNQTFPEDIFTARTDEVMNAALEEANIIVDASTSIAVARFLARDIQSDARRVTVFLNPTGRDAALLAEDEARDFAIDGLETQYYRAILNEERLAKHITVVEHVRYSAGCRDVAARIGQDDVALVSGLLAKQLRMLDVRPTVAVWQLASDGNVVRINVPIMPSIRSQAGEWEVVADAAVIAHAQQLRTDRLPTETGGIMVGYFDVTRRCIYIVDVLPAPADSTEHRSAFIRGFQGLRSQLMAITDRTGGQVGYIGEWHSHPKGVSVRMSDDDADLLSSIAREVRVDGWPGVIMIVGDNDAVAFYTQDAAKECK